MKLLGTSLLLTAAVGDRLAGNTRRDAGNFNRSALNFTDGKQEPDVKDAVVTNIHAVNAAQAANQAEQAAIVANKVAHHTQEVAKDAIAALRYTRDALLLVKSGDSDAEAAELTRAADALEAEAGLGAGTGYHESQTTRAANDAILSKLEGRLEKLESEYSSRQTVAHTQEVHQGVIRVREQLNRLADAEEGIAIDSTVVPYQSGAKEFGSEQTANTLTHASISESDGMIHQIEKAQSVESKRAVFRALTHLRGATIAAYDGIAHAHMKNVEEYAMTHHWRTDHPVRTLAEEEADVGYWAFPGHSPNAVAAPAMKIVANAAAHAAPAAAPAASR